jgi:hypothetical protein
MRLPQMNQWEMLQINWVDSAAGEAGWHNPTKSEFEIDGCVSVGMAYAQSHDRIVLILSRATLHDQIDGLITIPTCAITGYARLVPKKS